jgi:hypothetical protein
LAMAKFNFKSPTSPEEMIEEFKKSKTNNQ